MSGATTVRRSAPAIRSRTCRGKTLMIAAAKPHSSSNAVSTRVPDRTLRGTSSSATQDGPVLLLIVEDAPRAAHHAREWIFIDMDRQPGFLGEHDVEATNQCAATRHHD